MLIYGIQITDVIACVFFDVDDATIGLTNLTNYLVQHFLHFIILFWTLDSPKYLRINNIRKNSNAWLPASDNLSSLG